ncbi:MAG: MBL fold metallo-hydrolase [Clostridiaceae bacterium]
MEKQKHGSKLLSFFKDSFFKIKTRIKAKLLFQFLNWKLGSTFYKLITVILLIMFLMVSGVVLTNPRTRRIIFSGNNEVYKNLNLILNKDTVKIHMIDCGQGDSILLEVLDKVIMIDAGPPGYESKISKYISSISDRIDILILTHPHGDHITAAPIIMAQFKPKVVFLSHDTLNDPILDEVKTLAAMSNTLVRHNEKGTSINLGEKILLECIHPEPIKYSNINNYSGVYRLKYLDESFLFLGDLEKDIFPAIYSNNSIDIDFLKAGHHGSDTSMNEEFLDKTSPKFIGISVGYKNLFKHPSDKVKNLLEAFNVPYSRTDLHGTIVITSNGKRILHN